MERTQIISLEEFNNNPLYEDMKKDEVVLLRCSVTGKRPYRCEEYYPYKVEDISINKKVKIVYRRLCDE